MRILYSGPLVPGSWSAACCKAMLDLGAEVTTVDQTEYLGAYFRGQRSFLQKLQVHSLCGPAVWAYRRSLVVKCRAVRPHIVYIDQAAYLSSFTVEALKKYSNVVLHYTAEYLGYGRYWYRKLLRAAPSYTAHVITNDLNVQILEEHGAKKIIRTSFGYRPDLHVPTELSPLEREQFGADVVFVGHWEPRTEERINHLRKAGISVKVWGPGWKAARTLKDAGEIRPLYDQDYVKALAAAKICLCLLSHWNKNQATFRTFEIPAIGAFMLAERTPEQQEYFKDREEACFFSGNAQLVELARYYLSHDDERQRIAANGYRHCISSPYSAKERVAAVLSHFCDLHSFDGVTRFRKHEEQNSTLVALDRNT